MTAYLGSGFGASVGLGLGSSVTSVGAEVEGAASVSQESVGRGSG